MRTQFEKQLQKLKIQLNEMSFVSETLLNIATTSLQEQATIEEQETVQELKKEVYARSSKGENLCLNLLLKQQPVARDLHFISSAIQVFNNLVRISEQSIEIFMLIDRPINQFVLQSLQIEKMSEISKQMVHESMNAFLQNDDEVAVNVIQSDDIVDRYFNKSRNTFIDIVETDNTFAEDSLNSLLIAKYYEKISDHAVNIAKMNLE